MTALATPTLRRLPAGAAVCACLSLAAALVVGPGGTVVPSAVLAVLALALVAGEILRRALQILRSGLSAQLALGALVLAFAAAVWWLIAGFHAEYLAVGLLFAGVGGALVLIGVADARLRLADGATPWQALTGGPTDRSRAQDRLRRFGPLLLGAILLLLGVRLLVDALYVLVFSSGLTMAGGRLLQVLPGGYLLAGLVGSALRLLILAAVAIGGYVAVSRILRGAGAGAGGGSGSVWQWGKGLANPLAEKAPDRDEQVVAAHLHDSVLQTLALIQRNTEDPAKVAHLARQQERSLRSWLAGRDEATATTLAGALRAAAQEVEDEQPGAVIEVVAVGDAPLDRGADAMVRAAREAMRNAVRHAGSPVRVFVEIEGDVRELYVRDQGAGFDLATVGDERRGVRDAIIGRMEHVGGTAEIDSSSAGTEIALRLVVSSTAGEFA